MNLKSAREAAGLSQEKAAQRVGVSYKTIHRWENGDSIPSDYLIKLADAYGVPRNEALNLIAEAS